MEPQLQEKFRVNLVEKYQERAWECLANYNYYGQQYVKIEEEVKTMEIKIVQAEAMIKEIGDGKEYHTAANKEKVKNLRKDILGYNNRIKSVEGLMKKFFEESVKWQQDGVRILEQAENFKTFSLKTPEEISKETGQPIVSKNG